MSEPHNYHRPNTPDSPAEDSESDLEIDLQELNPVNVQGRSWGDENNYSGYGRGRRQIPLRSLRTGQNNHSNKQAGDTRERSSWGHPQEDTDLRDSVGSVEDEAPLLGYDAPDRSSAHGRGSGLSSRLNLPSFLSSGQSPSTSERVSKSQSQGTSRNFTIGQHPPPRFPPNAVSNAKYSPWSFLPRTLYNEFSFFFNLYFLLVALSQIIPPLRIGYLSTYVAPLAFVLVITLGKEALDDIARRRRDNEANKEGYTVLRLRDTSEASSKKRGRKSTRSKQFSSGGASPQRNRLDAIAEEEDGVGQTEYDGNIEVDEITIKSRDLKVGDVLRLSKDQRVPADLVILRSYTAESVAAPSPMDNIPKLANNASETLIDDNANDSATDSAVAEKAVGPPDLNAQLGPDPVDVGEAFIRTDQLDGETDWKLRLATPLTQPLDPRSYTCLRIVAGKPDKKVNEFIGTVEYTPRLVSSSATQSGLASSVTSASLTIDNTAWANTVLASNATVLAVVVYTGAQTRQAMSTSQSRSKTGLLEREINNLTKILCALTLSLSVILVALEGFESRKDQKWYVAIMRFLILFSTIIPISLRVNLDMGKTVYAWFIERDQDIPDTVVRTSTIPEELGRIEYLLSDKTGTLTQNEMELKKIHVGTVSYANEAMEEVTAYVKQGFSAGLLDATEAVSLVTPSYSYNASAAASTTRTRREIESRVRDLVMTLALCHNVTPTTEEEDGHSFTTYQASSPDEIAIVKWTEAVGLRLLHRDRQSITLQSVDTSRVVVRVRILDIFPFTSEGKRMGVILQYMQGEESTMSATEEAGEIWFYQKGADTVMASIVAANDWLDEETANMAREGLRTLVVGRKKLSPTQYRDFSALYKQASMSLTDRDANMSRTIKTHLESSLELLGITGVEDKLQKDVKPSLELLRNAGLKIWMLTGDKVETARCVAVSAKLVSRTQTIHTITNLSSSSSSSTAALDALSLISSAPSSTALLIDGASLSHYLTHHRTQFISLAVLLPAVIACRCSPSQKADIATLIRQHTHKRVACIGDGGNDVSMIQAADIGVGIVGKEGRQASLAADFSITSFHHLTKLLVWHGRNSYKRSAKLAQFVMHRGLVISVCQTVYSIATRFEPHALYRDWLLVGYATVYTMAPVFSLVLDRDVDEGVANLYPELYKELTSGASLSYKTFFIWVLISLYQGIIIQGLSQLLTHSVDSPRMVSVSFTVLVINELIMVACEVVTWHWIMVASLVGTMTVYVGSVPFLGGEDGYFDLGYVWGWGFVWRVVAICAISLVPVYSAKVIRRTLRPPAYRKVTAL